MPKFSQKSLDRLATCHPDLQTLFNEVIKHFDCTISEGHRGQAEQDAAYAKGNSKLKWPNGNHNAMPSNAVDAFPCPYDEKNLSRFYWFAGYIMGIAEMLYIQGKIKHKIRFGGDWNDNKDITDESFKDLFHYEIIP